MKKYFVSLKNKNKSKFDIKLNIDFNYMITKYGFKLSDFELEIYLTHVNIWHDFLKGSDQYALIMENICKVNVTDEVMKQYIDSLPNDWDIFFPYNGSVRKLPINSIGYSFDFKWGTDAYFISRKGALELIKNRPIKLPLDDDFFELCIKKQLIIHFDETTFFKYNSPQKYLEDRNKSVLDAIFNIQSWTIKDKDQVQLLLKKLFDIARNENLDLFINEGTLLGYVRHNKIMDWDDDVDLALNIKDLTLLLKALNAEKEICFKEHFWGVEKHLYYKFWLKSAQTIPGHEHKFPFVDIWLYEKGENSIQFNHGADYSNSVIYPLLDKIFESVQVKIPFKPISYLDSKYKSWKTEISVFPLSHRSEKIGFPTLNAKIKVNKLGQIQQDLNQEI